MLKSIFFNIKNKVAGISLKVEKITYLQLIILHIVIFLMVVLSFFFID